ncbi:MAG: hydantoinase/oxoprolinase family protein, partial [Pseudomonadota bacterium]
DHIAPLTRQFEQSYAAQFSRPVPGMDIEILNWALQVKTPIASPERVPAPVARDNAIPSARCDLFCDLEGGMRQAAQIDRSRLQPGMLLEGPALITESQTTTFIGADFKAIVDDAQNLILTRVEEHAP